VSCAMLLRLRFWGFSPPTVVLRGLLERPLPPVTGSAPTVCRRGLGGRPLPPFKLARALRGLTGRPFALVSPLNLTDPRGLTARPFELVMLAMLAVLATRSRRAAYGSESSARASLLTCARADEWAQHVGCVRTRWCEVPGGAGWCRVVPGGAGWCRKGWCEVPGGLGRGGARCRVLEGFLSTASHWPAPPVSAKSSQDKSRQDKSNRVKSSRVTPRDLGLVHAQALHRGLGHLELAQLGRLARRLHLLRLGELLTVQLHIARLLELEGVHPWAVRGRKLRRRRCGCGLRWQLSWHLGVTMGGSEAARPQIAHGWRARMARAEEGHCRRVLQASRAGWVRLPVRRAPDLRATSKERRACGRGVGLGVGVLARTFDVQSSHVVTDMQYAHESWKSHVGQKRLHVRIRSTVSRTASTSSF
jgi:hypothetical protein